MEARTHDDAMRARRRQLDEQAANWLLRLEDEPSPETEKDFRHWLESSAEHMHAFLEMTATDRDLDGLNRFRELDLDALVAEVRDEHASNVVSLTQVAVAPASPAHRRTARWGTAVAATVALLAIAVGFRYWLTASRVPVYATTTGEQRAVKLDDGSLIHLNTRSRIEVLLSQKTREVKLLEGEAMFTVERDRQRPFRVVTGSAVVEVVGTQFNVYRRSVGTTVSVIEGRVNVTGNGHRISLGAGEEAKVAADGRVLARTKGTLAKATAWQQRQLTFDHDSLEYVAEQFNRYNKIQIRVTDPRIRARELEGVFNADEPQALLDFLALERDLRFEREGDTINIRLRAATAEP